jgi:alkanesulfonate monooxygenase SsuD/methylene tetrahydromethanopterin reductase-like flavin-dependent oxidoreductase (luciferase family)
MPTPWAIPVGVNPTVCGVTGAWWLEAARRSEEAGFATVWAWDHFISRGNLDDPWLECFTTLTAAAVSTERIGLGTFVVNNVNRHPAVLANIVATLADFAPGRVELGIGIGGHPLEHESYGMAYGPARERAEMLEEALAVLRLLFTGGPVDFEGRHYQLREARSFPVPDPVPRITIAGMKPAGTRMAARLGDAWTCFDDTYDELRPVFDAALGDAGRSAADVGVIVGIHHEQIDEPVADLAERWRERGATELILFDLDDTELDRVLGLV